MSRPKELNSMTGRRATSVWRDENFGATVGYNQVVAIVFSNEYLGNREEQWFVAYDQDGNEIARYNASQMTEIKWAKEVSADE